jgi:hypothetical protein
MIKYSDAFIEQVKQAFPNNAELHAALDSGSHDVGSMLTKEAERVWDLHRLWTKEISANIAQVV